MKPLAIRPSPNRAKPKAVRSRASALVSAQAATGAVRSCAAARHHQDLADHQRRVTAHQTQEQRKKIDRAVKTEAQHESSGAQPSAKPRLRKRLRCTKGWPPRARDGCPRRSASGADRRSGPRYKRRANDGRAPSFNSHCRPARKIANNSKREDVEPLEHGNIRRLALAGSTAPPSATIRPGRMLIRKIQCQDCVWVSQPPTKRPQGGRAAAQPRRPWWWREFDARLGISTKTAVKTDGISMPPKNPCTTRAAIRTSKLVDSAQAQARQRQSPSVAAANSTAQRQGAGENSGQGNRHHFGHQIGGLNPAQPVQRNMQRGLDGGERDGHHLDVQTAMNMPRHMAAKPSQRAALVHWLRSRC